MNEIARWVFLIYFITHIPITLVVDFQIIFGQWYPASLQSVITFYLQTYRDPLIEDKPVWFQSFIVCEAIYQMPFFFVAVYALWFKKNWIRVPGVFYGAHVATTVWAILAEFLFSPRIDNNQKATLIGFYAPYFVVPLAFSLILASKEEIWADNSKSSITAKKES
jgi:EXPERA (EXPanded EBP superfamily)